MQMCSGENVDANLATAERLVRHAADDGAQMVVLPEKWPLVADRQATVAAAQPLHGPIVVAVRGWARGFGVAIVAGSFGEAADGQRVHNTCVVADAHGEVVAVYRKMHLFDVEAGGRRYRESDEAVAGDRPVAADVAGLRVGVGICYDLRFPELFRAYADAGATCLVVPAAFTAATGPAHWEVLLRARAIENQCAVVASAQVGRHPNGMVSHGHSMVVDCWGSIQVCMPDGEGVVVADVDLAAQRDVRRTLPALSHRRRAIPAAE